MFKGSKKYIWIFAGLFLVILLVQYFLPKPINWNRNFSASGKSPFDCYAIYSLLKGTYAETLEENKRTLYGLNDHLGENKLVLMINEQANFTPNDVKALYKILNKGNDVFIASAYLGEALRDSLDVASDYYWGMEYFTGPDSLVANSGVGILLTAANNRSVYRYPKELHQTYFSSFDTSRFKVLATIENKKACLIAASIGKGKLYLMSMPDVFGNYFIVNHPNRFLVYNMLSIPGKKEMVWDDYYKSAHKKRTSLLVYVYESEALYMAFLLILITLVLFLVFESRRTQRSIPSREPVLNSTLEFVNVISHVYFNSKNHKHIATERIRYFYETVRKRFGVNTNQPPEKFIGIVSQLSGVADHLVRQLFVFCENINQAPEITELELAELDRQMSVFNKNSLR